MTESKNCPSCGAANQFPEGRTTMFCAFCGNAIEQQIFEPKINYQKSKLNKSKIIDNALAFKDRKIESLDEIINLYSDTELETIEDLDLSNNSIKSLKGLSKLVCNCANFSFNDLSLIDDFPSIDFREGGYNYIDINCSNNKNLTGITEHVILKINSYKNLISNFTLNLEGVNNFDFETLSKINFKNILQLPTHLQSSFVIGYLDSKIEIPSTLKDVGFNKIMTTGGSGLVFWSFTYENTNSANESYRKILEKREIEKKEKIFSNFSTTDWLHLLSPIVLSLIMFFLAIKWDFTSIEFLGCLGLGSVITIFISLIPYLDYKQKTGRSFETKIGKIEEYKTVNGGGTDSNYWWKINLFHILVIILCFKFSSFGTSSNDSIRNNSSNDASNSDNQANANSNPVQEKINEEDGLNANHISVLDSTDLEQNNENSNSSDSQKEEVNSDSYFIGGDEALFNFLGTNINYPSMEKDAGISGTVTVSFDVLADGSVSNCEILKGVKGGPGLDKEALRVFQLLPKFEPAIKDGIAVSSKKSFQFKFVLR
jgi:TonB family protein